MITAGIIILLVLCIVNFILLMWLVITIHRWDKAITTVALHDYKKYLEDVKKESDQIDDILKDLEDLEK